MSEKILCFKSELLEQLGSFQGVSLETEEYLKEILHVDNAYFIDRVKAETDEKYKQIIPYVLLVYRNELLFTYKRSPQAGEKRLHEQWSIGIGGHVNNGDINTSLGIDNISLSSALRRELEEEVEFADPAWIGMPVPVALINDDKNAVGRVHFGVVYVALVTNANIFPKDKEIKESCFLPFNITKCGKLTESFEPWSRLCLKRMNDIHQKYMDTMSNFIIDAQTG